MLPVFQNNDSDALKSSISQAWQKNCHYKKFKYTSIGWSAAQDESDHQCLSKYPKVALSLCPPKKEKKINKTDTLQE